MVDVSRSWRVGLVLLLAASTAAAQAQQPGAAPQAQQPGVAAEDGSTKRLGRKYPVSSPPLVTPREPLQVYVSVVSPSDSSVHQKTGRFRRGRAGAAEPQAGGLPAESGLMR